MVVIVDGYNVLKYDHGATSVTEQEIAVFVGLVRSRARYMKYKVIVVFDGGASSYPLRVHDRTCEVAYAGARASADDMIRGLSEKYRGKENVVITADRILCNDVMRNGSYCVAPRDYLAIVYSHERHGAQRKSIAAEIAAYPEHDISGDDIDALMEMGSRHVLVKDDDRQHGNQIRQSKSYTVPKHVKQLQRIMDKL